MPKIREIRREMQFLFENNNFERHFGFSRWPKEKAQLYLSVLKSKAVNFEFIFAKRIITSRLDDVNRMGGVFQIIPPCSFERNIYLD